MTTKITRTDIKKGSGNSSMKVLLFLDVQNRLLAAGNAFVPKLQFSFSEKIQVDKDGKADNSLYTKKFFLYFFKSCKKHSCMIKVIILGNTPTCLNEGLSKPCKVCITPF